MADIEQEIEQVVSSHGRPLANAMKSSARQSGHQKSGALTRSMRPKVRKDGIDVWGLSVSMKRYGFILHHGMESQVVERSGTRFLSSGFSGSGFLSQAMDEVVPKLADDLSRLGADLTVNRMNF